MDFPIESEWNDEAPAAAGRQDRQNVPEGVHEFTIKQVIEDTDRLEIRLEHDERKFGWVFLRIPKANPAGWQKKLVGQLAACLALTREQWAASEPGDVAGSRVSAEIRHRDGGNGRTYVNVWSFLPPEQKPAPQHRPVAAKTPLQKAKAAAKANGTGDDDIPF